MTAEPHSLYRFFDAGGTLLYIGRTINPGRRWREHEKSAHWYPAVASVTREVFPTAEAVSLAERAAIVAEGPLYNIAHNPGAVPPTRPLMPLPNEEESLAVRWAAAGIAPEDVAECEQDPTICECEGCHQRRLVGLENLRAKYDWHPDVSSEIDSVERRYYEGHDLFDWYYDYFDVEMFGRMRLTGESATRPLPAFAELDDRSATVDCPFCFDTHRHFLTPGLPLSTPFEAPCDRVPRGRYVLFGDWLDMRNALDVWGRESARERAA